MAFYMYMEASSASKVHTYMDSAYPQTASCSSYINVHVNVVQSFVIDIATVVPHDSPICMQNLEKILIGSLCIYIYIYNIIYIYIYIVWC